MSLEFSTSDSQGMTWLRILVHGDSGMGKTTSLRTLPEDHTLIAVTERNTVPLNDYSFMTASIHHWDQLRELVAMIMQAPRTANGVEVNGKDICVLVIDSLTMCSEMCKKRIVSKDRKALIQERTKGRSDKPTGIYEDQMGLEDWNVYQSRMANFINTICRLPVHVIFTSLSKWTEDKRNATMLRTPELNGKLAQTVPAFFDLVLHMEPTEDEDGEATRVWRTINDGQHLCKDASGKLAEFEPADYAVIFKKILGKAPVLFIPGASTSGKSASKDTKAKSKTTKDETKAAAAAEPNTIDESNIPGLEETA